MRIWLHTSAKSSALSQSAAFSMAAHAAIIGAAVYGTGQAAQELQDRQTTTVTYLAPPDRQVASRDMVEHLQFVDVSVGAAVGGDPMPAGSAPPTPEQFEAPHVEPVSGTEELMQAGRPFSPSPDSVYSILTVDETAARAEGSAAPLYPQDLLREGIEGSVTVRYVVDSAGLAEPGSLTIVATTHPAFTFAVQQAMPGMRFHSAKIAGRPVREVVEQTFHFRIEAPPLTLPEHTRTKPVP
jgi:TonB family protein